MRRFLMAVLAVVGLSSLARAEVPALHNSLRDTTVWDTYKGRFLDPSGRVVDNVNGRISHSEGQGYGMVIAVAANDPAAFKQMFDFAETELAIREDALYAWRYDPANEPKVKDLNNASDGDLLIAWALLEAAEAGWGKEYRERAEQILRDLRLMLVETPGFGTVMLPGEHGFYKDGIVTINPAYWVYPALERVATLTSEPIWRELAASGVRMTPMLTGAFGGMVPDWLAINTKEVSASLSDRMSTNFGYEAIRVPLYALWSKSINPNQAAAIIASAQDTESGLIRIVDLRTGASSDQFRDPGYSVIAHLARCAVAGHKIPNFAQSQIDGNYYPATLQLLSLVAARQRYPQCM